MFKLEAKLYIYIYIYIHIWNSSNIHPIPEVNIKLVNAYAH